MKLSWDAAQGEVSRYVVSYTPEDGDLREVQLGESLHIRLGASVHVGLRASVHTPAALPALASALN